MGVLEVSEQQPRAESPTALSPAEQNNAIFHPFSTHQPSSTSGTGRVASRIKSPYFRLFEEALGTSV